MIYITIAKLNEMTAMQINQGKVYGSISIQYLGDNQFKIYPDKYNFDYQPNIHNNANVTLRNIGTIFSGMIHGVGRSFSIKFQGTYKYRPTTKTKLY